MDISVYLFISVAGSYYIVLTLVALSHYRNHWIKTVLSETEVLWNCIVQELSPPRFFLYIQKLSIKMIVKHFYPGP